MKGKLFLRVGLLLFAAILLGSAVTYAIAQPQLAGTEARAQVSSHLLWLLPIALCLAAAGGWAVARGIVDPIRKIDPETPGTEAPYEELVPLLARIRAAVRHTRTPIGSESVANTGIFKAGDLTIDYAKHRVFVAGRDAMLTQNEYKLVSLLGLHAGKVLTYDYLIRELWGPSAKSDNQILRVNMANIRRKIEKNPASPEYIFTEIGVGYRMLENEA